MQILRLPDRHVQHWLDALPGQLQSLKAGTIQIECGDWRLSCSDLQRLLNVLAEHEISLEMLSALLPETVVSANALGLPARLIDGLTLPPTAPDPDGSSPQQLLFHQGTLRSGDQLRGDGDILVLGDVNPGATLSAAGHVMVWGRLRGIAHAGREGDRNARIVALQLRPLQLRIADIVARGPEDVPQLGLAEQARLDGDDIVIEPAPAERLGDR
ncbi:MAG: septum site-determining protein MinC [Cyanobacteriota bacterium]|nr:septum site-determining protein MinC [Cyanobacteriota bacterium]